MEIFCRPIFSSEFINTDKSKMERFLHAGRFSVASVCAKISFPPLPTIILKRAGEDATPAVAALGSLKTVDRDRIILKRVILTGYVYFYIVDVYYFYKNLVFLNIFFWLMPLRYLL
jgi:pre-rRNA-processing protein TSR1